MRISRRRLRTLIENMLLKENETATTFAAEGFKSITSTTTKPDGSKIFTMPRFQSKQISEAIVAALLGDNRTLGNLGEDIALYADGGSIPGQGFTNLNQKMGFDINSPAADLANSDFINGPASGGPEGSYTIPGETYSVKFTTQTNESFATTTTAIANLGIAKLLQSIAAAQLPSGVNRQVLLDGNNDTKASDSSEMIRRFATFPMGSSLEFNMGLIGFGLERVDIRGNRSVIDSVPFSDDSGQNYFIYEIPEQTNKVVFNTSDFKIAAANIFVKPSASSFESSLPKRSKRSLNIGSPVDPPTVGRDRNLQNLASAFFGTILKSVQKLVLLRPDENISDSLSPVERDANGKLGINAAKLASQIENDSNLKNEILKAFEAYSQVEQSKRQYIYRNADDLLNFRLLSNNISAKHAIFWPDSNSLDGLENFIQVLKDNDLLNFNNVTMPVVDESDKVEVTIKKAPANSNKFKVEVLKQIDQDGFGMLSLTQGSNSSNISVKVKLGSITVNPTKNDFLTSPAGFAETEKVGTLEVTDFVNVLRSPQVLRSSSSNNASNIQSMISEFESSLETLASQKASGVQTPPYSKENELNQAVSRLQSSGVGIRVTDPLRTDPDTDLEDLDPSEQSQIPLKIVLNLKNFALMQDNIASITEQLKIWPGDTSSAIDDIFVWIQLIDQIQRQLLPDAYYFVTQARPQPSVPNVFKEKPFLILYRTKNKDLEKYSEEMKTYLLEFFQDMQDYADSLPHQQQQTFKLTVNKLLKATKWENFKLSLDLEPVPSRLSEALRLLPDMEDDLEEEYSSTETDELDLNPLLTFLMYLLMTDIANYIIGTYNLPIDQFDNSKALALMNELYPQEQVQLAQAAEGRKRMKHSLLNLLEEQMMAPMPALGGGSAPLDSRVIDDPFDLDLETQSLLGLTRAAEIDIDEDSVDSDFDGVPNELDTDDDTPQIDTMIAERFMQDLLRNEKRVKSERSNFEVGESHATKLKKKYYGRY